jgi:Rieske Fe-S protein
MGEEEHERFEDYLELERYLEQLHMQKSARLPANLAPQQKSIYSMALLFHTALPRRPDLRPEFRAQLYERLRQQVRTEEQLSAGKGTDTGWGQAPPQVQRQFRNIYKHGQIPEPAQISSPHPESRDVKKRKIRRLSRRTLFTSGAIAASLLAGVGIGTGIEQSLEPKPTPPNPHPLIHEDVAGTWNWYHVASVEELGTEAIPFKVNTMTGYVIRQAGTTSDESIIALSAACPHLGCIVQWQKNAQHFLCPCHERTFDAEGDPNNQNFQLKLTALPRLETRIDPNGNIYIKAP